MKRVTHIPGRSIERICVFCITLAMAAIVVSQALPGLRGMVAGTVIATLAASAAVPIFVWLHHQHQPPALVAGTPDPRRARWQATLTVIATLLTGLSFTAVITLGVVRQNWHDAREDFDRLSERLTSEVTHRIRQLTLNFGGIQGLIAAGGRPTREQFNRYAATQALANEFPGATGIGFIERVPIDQLDSFVRRERADSGDGFDVNAGPGREIGSAHAGNAYIVNYIYPLEANRRMWGYDMSADPSLREAIERAVNSGEATISGKVRLVQDDRNSASIVCVVPLYKDGINPESPSERRTQLVGLAFAPVVIEHCFAGMIDAADELLDCDVFDDSGPDVTPLLDTDAGMNHTRQDVEALKASTLFANEAQVEIAGRCWTMLIRSRPKFEAEVDQSSAALLGSGGLFISVLLSIVVWAIGTSRTQSTELAEKMTAELKASEVAAKCVAERAQRLAEIARRTSNAVVMVDRQGYIEWVNEGFTRITGYTLEEIAGQRRCQILKGPLSDPRISEQMAEAVGIGRPLVIEHINYDKSGVEHVLRLEIMPMRDADGAVSGAMSIETDITEQTRANAALRFEQERLDLAVKGTGLGMWDWNPIEDTLVVSDHLAALYGHHVDELPESATAWAHRIHPDDLPVVARTMEDCLRNGSDYACEHRMLHRNGSWRWILDHGRIASKSSDGAVTRVVGTHLDITARKEAEERLAAAKQDADAASRVKSEFLANMSHEIRTPLTAILGFADLLREQASESTPAQRSELIDTIKNAGTHLLAVINDILDLSKIEAERMSMERADTSFPNLVCEVTSLMRHKCDAKGVALLIQTHTPVPDRIITDPTRLRQILVNLVGNAAKFTDAGSVIVSVGVTNTRDCNRLVVDVEDTGPGMTAQQAEQLFVAFGQIDTSATRRHGGTGLGLTISRRLAGLMGGTVSLVRTEPGRGSCFRVDLPLETPANATTVADIAAPEYQVRADAPRRSPVRLDGRILLAEDGIDNQRLIAFHLRKAGAKVDIADNGRIALEMLDAAAKTDAPYDLLVSDMQMPEMDGYTLARALRSRGSDLPILALTAHAMASDRDECLLAGCNEYASKPVDAPKLIELCNRWMKVSSRAA